MSVQRVKVDGEAALVAQVGPSLHKVVYPSGKVSFFVPDAEARDWNPFQRRVPKGETGGGQWAGENLSKDERTEIRYYTTKAYRHINSSLREGLAYVLGRTVVLMDSAIAKSVVGKDVSLFRGVDSDKFLAKLEGLKLGEEITDKAYTSASGSYLAASQYAGAGRPVMEVFVPRGSNVLYAESMSVSQGLGEEEHILPRNSTFRYTGKTGRPGQVRYQFDLVRKSVKDAYDPSEPRVPAGEPGGGQWRGENLTKQEKDSVYDYTGSAYSGVNSELRSGKDLSSDTRHLVALIDSALAKSALTSDTVVYRGVNSSAFVDQLNALQPGEAITDSAYVSTSGSLSTAAKFSGLILGAPVMEVRLPAGSRALYTEEFSANSGAEEDEYLLPRGTTFRYVTSRTTKTGKKIHTFDLASRATTDAYNPDQPRVPKGQSGGGRWGSSAESKSPGTFEELLAELSSGTARKQFGSRTESSSDLTDAERDAILRYSGDEFEAMNEALRSGDASAADAELDSAIEKSKFVRNSTLYRGVNEDFAAQLEGLRPGQVVSDAGYVSTSLDSSYAKMYSQTMVIKASKGQTGLHLSEDFARIEGEQEVLLPRGTQFRYRGKSGGKYRFDLVSSAKDWNPFQPRLPKGQTGGGEWTEGGATGGGKLSLTGNKPVGLQPVHADALKQYTASIYYPVNKGLRDETPLSTQEQAVVSALDEAFDRAMRTTEVMQLFRAAGEEFASVVDTLKVGEDVTDKAFVSTTFDEQYARTLMSGQSGDRKALIEVVLPKDSRAIDTSPFNPFKGENETLLPRNTTFRYLGKERDVYRFRANPRPIAA